MFITKLSPDGTTLVYSTYLSGAGGSQAAGIAVDTNGSAYVVGLQGGGGFPYTPGSYQGPGLGEDFVTKLSPEGSQLVYSASLGTISNNGITVDSMGNAYVASAANSPTGSPSSVAQVAKVSPNGSGLVYQAELPPPDVSSGNPGNPLPASGNGIAIDALGEAFIAGGYKFERAPGDTRGPCPGGIVWKLSSDGSTVIYANTLGDSCQIDPSNRFGPATNIAIDTSGDAYAVSNGVILKFDPNGSKISGGGANGMVSAIAVDRSGIVCFTGATNSTQFSNETTPDAFQSQLPGQQSAFVDRVDASGTDTLYATYFGGSSIDGGNAIALDSQGNGYITGYTTSTDFPHTGGAFQGSLNGNQNAFVAKWVFPIVPTPTTTPTDTPTPVPTVTPTARKTSAPLPTPTSNGSPSATVTRTPAPTTQATTQATPTITMTPTMTAASTPTAVVTPTTTVTATPTPVPVGPLAIAPAKIDFGQVRVGTTSVEHLVRLVNPARNKSPLMITSLGLASAPASGFEIDGNKSSCHVGDSIARGKSCTVYIAFAPPAQGAYSDNLVVTGNFTNSGHHLPLFGTGF